MCKVYRREPFSLSIIKWCALNSWWELNLCAAILPYRSMNDADCMNEPIAHSNVTTVKCVGSLPRMVTESLLSTF